MISASISCCDFIMSDGSKRKVHIAQQQEEEEVKGAQHRRGDQGPIIYLVNPETWLRPLLIICLHLGATTKVPPPKYQSATTQVPLLKCQSTTNKVPKCYYQSATTKVPLIKYQSATTKVSLLKCQSTTTKVPKCYYQSATTKVPLQSTKVLLSKCHY